MRYHGLDLLRGVAMLLGVVLHAMLLFQAPEIIPKVLPEARVTPPPTAPATWAATLWIHVWRMPLFFVLAGFFAELVIARRGLWHFARDRATRIALTLLVFVTVLGLVLQRSVLTLDHLWFLWFLALFCAARVGLGALGVTTPALPARAMLPVALAVFIVAATARINGFWHVIPLRADDFVWQGFLLYAAYFVTGLLLYHARGVVERLARRIVWITLLGVGMAAFVTMFLLLGSDPNALAMAPLSGLTTWAWTFGLIGMAQALVRQPRRWIAWLVDASYPVYLFHLYPTLLFSALLIEAEVPQGWAIAGASAGGMIAAFGLWYLLVRYTPLDWIINGYHKAWWRWPFAPNGWRAR
ncbi:acyltransferase family protein [Pseudaestuariivita atlantica]|uniref:Acyltransferase 3 domain-containing protein n=1 Tax=Pseudaestuariivita atlantica TaxID=1317121 RepID=A0A0L1JR81_9RHOB|nr:acyltransferase family protein [Pseudaestuariivita atlantica]KNG94299.1 hypothetical protein ATO11_08830 [Pseudaestuariivita atlantica]